MTLDPAFRPARHICFRCRSRLSHAWTLFGFDDWGELWLCAECAATHDPGNPPRALKEKKVDPGVNVKMEDNGRRVTGDR